MAPPSKKQKVQRPWQEIAKDAQDHRDASLAQVKPGPESSSMYPAPEHALEQSHPSAACKISMKFPETTLHPRDVQITETLPEDLVQSLATGELSATDVTTAFLRRAVIAQKLVSAIFQVDFDEMPIFEQTNCVTELLPQRALERAKFLDDYYLEHKKPIGPLHGLPISVKEMIGMKDLGLNAGYVAWWGKTAMEDAHVLQILWNAGAVFHARTTQPQSMMHLETDSNLYGLTVNPYNRDMSAGGSSGGEGALIGMRASCLGVGSDIGGNS